MKRAALLLVGVALIAAVAPGAASPQPRPACGVCGQFFADAAAEAGLDLTVERTTVDVRIRDDGAAVWTVRNDANDSALASLRSDPDLRDRIVEHALAEPRGVADPPFRNASLTVEDGAAVLRFTDPDAARRIAGTYVVDYLHTGGERYWYNVHADRFEVAGPEGTVVANDPPGATVTGRRATWNDENGIVRVHDDAYVAFAPDGPLAGLRAGVAVAAATAPIVARLLVSVASGPVAVLAVGLVALHLGARRWLDGRDRRRLGVFVAAGGVLAIVVGATGPTYRLVGLGGVYLVAALAALLSPPGRSARFAGAMALPVVAVGLLWPAFFLLIGNEYMTTNEQVWRGFAVAMQMLPLAAVVPFGYLADRGRPAAGAGVVLGALLLALLATGALTSEPAWGLTILFYAAQAFLVAVVGVPLYLLGGALARSGDGGADDRGTGVVGAHDSG